MSADPLKSPEILRLLAEADNARALVDQMGPHSDASEALEGIYGDLGRALHRFTGWTTPTHSVDAQRIASSLPPADWGDWSADIDEDEPTVIDRPDEAEDVGIVSRRRQRR